MRIYIPTLSPLSQKRKNKSTALLVFLSMSGMSRSTLGPISRLKEAPEAEFKRVCQVLASTLLRKTLLHICNTPPLRLFEGVGTLDDFLKNIYSQSPLACLFIVWQKCNRGDVRLVCAFSSFERTLGGAGYLHLPGPAPPFQRRKRWIKENKPK